MLQNQPAHRDGEIEAQLHRFLGTKSGRKTRYGRLLAETVRLDRVPTPIVGLLAWVGRDDALLVAPRAGQVPAERCSLRSTV